MDAEKVTPEMLVCLEEVHRASVKILAEHKMTVESGIHILTSIIFGILYAMAPEPDVRIIALSNLIKDIASTGMQTVYTETPGTPKGTPDADRS